ncbi:PEP-CTERM sorting domain-containing protein [Roseateles koreensis]|uniref:PEP-CTERM sorting domain-containing protein n=1 Tax=Roseateles koreensis TaxID=2987526 RepID=A0ABT5KRL0_9BURK|nr:PEP-CTERM sorting domain-containing protein [Roseateles koreensis]MDC8785524.1 PEP-CTERM sorting domain-containing protein [Roseateles koreensis]
MKTLNFLITAALAACTLPAAAAPVFMDFETVPNAVNDLTVAANNPYAADVTFLSNALSMTSAWLDPTADGNFFRDPAVYGSVTKGAMFMSGGNDATTRLVFDVNAGFSSELKLLYAAGEATGTISVYDDVGGHGSRLSVVSLGSTGACLNPDTQQVVTGFVCNWRTVDINFSGTAQSVVISGTNNAFWFDDIRLGADGGGNVPEPSSVALSLAALGALGWSRKQRKG